PAPLLPTESTVELLRQRELRALARDEVLELLGERPTRSEEQRLERSRRESEQPCDLVVRAALELPHDERLALRGRNTLERADQLVDLDVVLAVHHRDVAFELDLCRPRR